MFSFIPVFFFKPETSAGRIEGAIVKSHHTTMDPRKFTRGGQNRNGQGASAGAGQMQHPLIQGNGSLFSHEPVQTLESLAAMEHLVAQQAARQMVETRTGYDQINLGGGLDLSALRGQSGLAQLQAQANQEAMASELAMRLAKQSRAEEALNLSDALYQRQHLLQQHALLSQHQQQQQQLEAIQRANQSAFLQGNMNQGNRELLHLQEEVQLLELLRVRQGLLLQRQKQEEGLKAVAMAAASSQQAHQQSNILASYNELDRLQALRQLQAQGGNDTGIGNNGPLSTAAALGVFGQRDINEILSQGQQQQRNQKLAASALKNNSKNARIIGSVPLLPKNSPEKKVTSPPQSKESEIYTQEKIALNNLIKRPNVPKKKRHKMVENGNHDGSGVPDNFNEKVRKAIRMNEKTDGAEVDKQHLRFFNNGVETHMDGSPLGMNKTVQTGVDNAQQNSVAITKNSSVQINGSSKDPSTFQGIKNNSAMPQNILKNGLVETNPMFNPLSKGKKKIPKAQMEINKSQFEVADSTTVPNSKMSKLFRRSNEIKRSDTPDSSNTVEKKFAAIPSIPAPAPAPVPNPEQKHISANATSTVTASQPDSAPLVKKLKKKPHQFIQTSHVIKKRKIMESSEDSLVNPVDSSKVSNVPIKQEDQSQNEGFETDKSKLSSKCTRDEFFAFVIERVPELAPSVAIIKGRFEEDEVNVVPLQAVNLILAELLYLANMDRSNSSSRKKINKSLPLLRENPSMRIFKCIKQIEKYKSSLVESMRPKKKVAEVVQSRIPIHTPSTRMEKNDKINNDMKPPKKDIISTPKQWKPATVQSHTEKSLKKEENEETEKENITVKENGDTSLKAQGVQAEPEKKEESNESKDLSGTEEAKQPESGDTTKKKEKSEEALNAARALLNFGVK